MYYTTNGLVALFLKKPQSQTLTQTKTTRESEKLTLGERVESQSEKTPPEKKVPKCHMPLLND
jgi:hypothetical protein